MFIDDAEPVLVFKAKLVSDVRDDSLRDFMVQYFLNDKTIQVFEGRGGNVGFRGGKFLSRMKVKNPRTQRDYDDESFALGEKLQLAGRVFELIEAPEYTLALMEANVERFPASDMQTSIEGLKTYLSRSRTDLKSKFDAVDRRGTGVIPNKDAEDILFGFTPVLSKQYITTILRRFGGESGFKCQQLLDHLEV